MASGDIKATFLPRKVLGTSKWLAKKTVERANSKKGVVRREDVENEKRPFSLSNVNAAAKLFTTSPLNDFLFPMSFLSPGKSYGGEKAIVGRC